MGMCDTCRQTVGFRMVGKTKYLIEPKECFFVPDYAGNDYFINQHGYRVKGVQVHYDAQKGYRIHKCSAANKKAAPVGERV